MIGTRPTQPLISIIVPTYNEERLLPILFQSIRRQAFQDYEIIVADDNSTDSTTRIALDHGARLVINNGIGEYPSRNAAADVAKGSVLLFTGADAIMSANFLSLLAAKFSEDPGLAGIYGPTYPYDAASWAKVEYTLWYVLTTLVYYVTREANASTAFLAVRTGVFKVAGGFRNTAFADSSLSRQLSKRFKIRPCLDMIMFVSGRRTQMGIARFNRYHLAMLVDVLFKFFGNSKWSLAEHESRMRVHTRSKPPQT